MTTTIFLLFIAALSASIPEPTTAAENDLGWHGEELPAGLERGAQEGEYLWTKDSSIMVYIPPGPFKMGSEEGHPNERPVHEVYLDGYYIDKYEVSWRQWKLSGLPFADHQFARVRYPEAPDWGIEDNYPVMSVSWIFAKKYVDWVGKGLPSEAQWEKAARGTDERRYPWGNQEPNFELALWREHPVAKLKSGPIDWGPQGVSPYGVYNMAGNVYEWCEDVYGSRYYSESPKKNPLNKGPGKFRILRGGAFVLDKSDLRSALRYRLREEDRAPFIGFRTVVNAVVPSR